MVAGDKLFHFPFEPPPCENLLEIEPSRYTADCLNGSRKS
ncbi:hypothetical protein Novomoskovsk_21 [Bacillus phage Novomoskovsk]|uniref:Uncharacterized protein n=1 Tax=Bacillus phage Novomoskovsk TaxID=2736258 RepID=A0A6M9Z7A2_9CAUD|nr:hypothetical protein Novomoskovsk_21 [Bacillus phage Novomoskovsk]